jgi:hypothetical protein
MYKLFRIAGRFLYTLPVGAVKCSSYISHSLTNIGMLLRERINVIHFSVSLPDFVLIKVPLLVAEKYPIKVAAIQCRYTEKCCHCILKGFEVCCQASSQK